MPNPLEKIPPHSVEAEQSLLGSLLLDPNAIYTIADFLRPKDFYQKNHRIIYEIILEMFSRQEPIDLLNIQIRLREKNILDEIGGVSYLTSLVNYVATPNNIAHYAKSIQKKGILRDLIEASFEIENLAYKESDDIDLVLDQAEQRIFKATQQSYTQEFMPVRNALEEAFERIERLHRGDGALRGISTGFYDLDNILGGFQKSDLIVLAARPTLGKTSLALDIARHVSIQEKIPVGIFSLEMSQGQLIDRLIASEAEVDLWKLRTGRLSMKGEGNDFEKISESLASLSEAPIYIDDSAATTALQIRTMARRLQAEKGLGLIIVDYLQLMQSHNSNYNNSMVQQITEISRSLKGLARELNVPVLAISQLSRAVEQRSPAIPKLFDLRESGSIEQDADVVMFIYRQDRDKKNSNRKNIADIIVAKQRNGPVGKISLYFNENQVSFKNLDKSYELTEDDSESD